MKTLRTVFCLLMVIAVLATGCKKDDNGDEAGSGKNNYTYLDATVKIIEAKSIIASVLGVNTISVTLKGEGTSKWIQLYFYKMGSIPTGSFIYMPNIDPRYNPATNFTGGNVNLDLAVGHEINGGTLNVTKNGDNYSFVLDAKTSRGPLTATYVGKVTAQ